MAPVTRRRTKALESSQPDSSFVSDVDGDSSLANFSSQSLISQESTPKTAKSTGRSKRKSTDAAAPQDGTLETPKRKRLAVRTRVEESPKGDHRIVHIEATMPVGDTNAEEEEVEDSAGENEDCATEPESAARQLQEEAIQKLASRSAEPEPAATATPTAAAPKSKHVVFGDDDDVDNFVAEAAAKDAERRQDQAEEDEEDSDDEAPEAVSTAAAAKQTKKAEQAAADAAEKLAATQKRKRQERDALFRTQAAERKRVADAELAKSGSTRQRISKRNLPDVLPAEFLEDSDSDASGGSEAEPDSHMRKLKKKRKLAEAEAALALAAKQSKKIRFDEVAESAERAEANALREQQRPRDLQRGGTVYRVLAAPADSRLAPKMHKSSRSTKESMLKRKRDAFSVNKKKGFFVKK